MSKFRFSDDVEGSYSVTLWGPQSLSFMERCPLFRVSFKKGSTVILSSYIATLVENKHCYYKATSIISITNVIAIKEVNSSRRCVHASYTY